MTNRLPFEEKREACFTRSAPGIEATKKAFVGREIGRKKEYAQAVAAAMVMAVSGVKPVTVFERELSRISLLVFVVACANEDNF